MFTTESRWWTRAISGWTMSPCCPTSAARRSRPETRWVFWRWTRSTRSWPDGPRPTQSADSALRPAAFGPDPAVRPLLPVARDPVRGWSGTLHILPGDPHILSAAPAPVAGLPNRQRRGRRWWGLHERRPAGRTGRTLTKVVPALLGAAPGSVPPSCREPIQSIDDIKICVYLSGPAPA